MPGSAWQDKSPSSAQLYAALLSCCLAAAWAGCLHFTCVGSLSSPPEVTSEAKVNSRHLAHSLSFLQISKKASYAQPKVSVRLGSCLYCLPMAAWQVIEGCNCSPRECLHSGHRYGHQRGLPLPQSYLPWRRGTRRNPRAVSGQQRCACRRSLREISRLFSPQFTPSTFPALIRPHSLYWTRSPPILRFVSVFTILFMH